MLREVGKFGLAASFSKISLADNNSDRPINAYIQSSQQGRNNKMITCMYPHVHNNMQIESNNNSPKTSIISARKEQQLPKEARNITDHPR